MLYIFVYSFLVLVVFLSCCYFSKKHSILIVLVLLEVITFRALLAFYAPLLTLYATMTWFVALVCFAASGAACGLRLLISLRRQSGRDLIKAFGYEKNARTRGSTRVTKTC